MLMEILLLLPSSGMASLLLLASLLYLKFFNVGGLPSFAGIHGVVGVTAVAFVPSFARVLAVVDVLAAASVPTDP
jgi:hypothetical protein